MTAYGHCARQMLFVGAAFLLGACATPVPQIDRGQSFYSDAVEATALVQPFPGGSVTGHLTVTPFANGIRIAGDLSGFPRAGEYGFHIKHTGDCSSPEASGAIFNPLRTRHGMPSAGEHMLGDLPNIDATHAGNVALSVQATGLTLGGGSYNDVAGRSLVIHEAADDHESQPEGNAGRRIACAVITVTNPPPVEV